MVTKELEITVVLSGSVAAVGKDLTDWIKSCLSCNPNHITVEKLTVNRAADVATPVQIRRDRETGLPILFYYNRCKDGSNCWLECFDMREGTNEPDDGYRLSCAKLDARNLPEDALKLLRHWNSLPGDYGVPVQRLRRPI